MTLALHFAYLVRCRDGSLYAGSTQDLASREARHNAGRGSRYVSGRLPVRIVYAEGFATQQDAMSRERDFKRLTREEKEALIASTRPRG